jgi:alpha-glucoside transport system substrate-binding protein
MRTSTRTAAALTAAALLAGPALGGCAGPATDGKVTVLATWTGAEETNFRKVLDRFHETTGIEVTYQGTRAARQVLLSEVQKGTPPDIAVLPFPTEMATYRSRSLLRPLGAPDGSAAAAQWRELEMLGTDQQRYVVPIKADLKGLIWYNPTASPGIAAAPPDTWGALRALSRQHAAAGDTPWCMGVAASSDAGWPGTDWIENILLHRWGVSTYRDWAAGRLAWNSPQVRQAWTAWGELVGPPGMVRGGGNATLLTDFTDADRPMFESEPGCRLHHQASFQIGIHKGYAEAERRPIQADFFDFPTFAAADGGRPDAVGPVREVSADVAGLFTDSPAARKLIDFLATDEAQRIWPESSGGTVFSVNQNLPMGSYDAPGARIARELTQSSAESPAEPSAALCFDASDLMPASMATEFQRAVLEFLHLSYAQQTQPDPGDGRPDPLGDLLDDLDRVRQGLRADGTTWLDLQCDS